MNSVATEGGGRPFITKWEGKRGKALELPIVGQYLLVIKDKRGKEVIKEEVTIADEEHPYLFMPPADGVYTVEAGPEGVEYMRTCEYEDCEDEAQLYEHRYATLREVVQFGTVEWRSMREMFQSCNRMTFAPDIDTPDLSKVTDMREMFRGCSAFNQPLEKWDVGNVTDMSLMFSFCRSFNQPLEKWDVGNVTDMSLMFSFCSVFNQPLEKWNVGKVTNMSEMFRGCSAFNQPLEKWDVGRVTAMGNMFSGCSAFNQPLEKWDVGKVKDMREMFCDCGVFNQSLEKWNVGKVKDMREMFSGCSAFNQSLAAWNISNLPKDAAKDLFTNCPAGALPFAQEWREKGYEL